MTIEQIRRQIKKEYSDKLNWLIDENYILRKKNNDQSAEIKFLREKVLSLEKEITLRNRRLDEFLELFDSSIKYT